MYVHSFGLNGLVASSSRPSYPEVFGSGGPQDAGPRSVTQEQGLQMIQRSGLFHRTFHSQITEAIEIPQDIIENPLKE